MTESLFKNLRQWFKNHGLPFYCGLILALVAIVLSFNYYRAVEEDKSGFWYRVIDNLHNQTVDLRMQVQDYRLGDKDIVVIAIDNRSLESEGRWPWERGKQAKLIENLFALGVKAVGLDIIFSEGSNQEIQWILNDLPKIPNLDAQAQKQIETYAKSKSQLFNADGMLTALFQKHSTKLISAVTYDIPRLTYQPYQQLCFNLVYAQSEAGRVFEKEGYDFIKIPPEGPEGRYDELPMALNEFLTQELIVIKNEQTEVFCITLKHSGNCPSDLSPHHALKLTAEISFAQQKYCSTWLEKTDRFFYDLKGQWPVISEKEEKLKGLSFADFIIDIRGSTLRSALLTVDDWTLNIPVIHQANRYSGFLNVHPDLDGKVRRIPLLVGSGPHIIPSLAMRLAMAELDADSGQLTLVKNPQEPTALMIRDLELTYDSSVVKRVPVDPTGQIRINFHGPRYAFPHASAREILYPNETNVLVTRLKQTNDELDVERDKPVEKTFLKDKIVVIGATATGVYDLRVTPFDENYPGVEAHATIADNIIHDDFLTSPAEEAPYMIVLLAVLGLVLSAGVASFGALAGLAMSSGVILGISFFDYFYFYKKGVVTTILPPIALALLIYLTLTILKYFTEERKKQMIKGTFEKYVSPAIVTELLHHPDNIKLGGRKEKMTVFFSDVRGFTTFSEKLDPTDLSDLLNMYLTPMTDLVFKNKGTLDKYMGDAIMAFFGAPVPSNCHAEDACRCALQHLVHLKVLNQELAEKELPAIDIGIGINTGDMSVGNMGSQTVRNYTVMGDAVNLGSRLEAINKQYGTHIILSEYTESQLPASFIRREIDWVQVKGKKEPVRIFELLGEGEPDDSTKNCLLHFKRGFHLYHQKKWPEAIAEFSKAVEVNENDSVSRLYIQRCHELAADPPDGEWNGVFVMKTK